MFKKKKAAKVNNEIQKISGIKKEYLASVNMCKVTFTLPNSAAPDSKSVHLVGEFNNWDINAHQMKRSKNGEYTITLKITPGKDYEFRYLIDQSKWENDYHADKYVRSPFGDSDNSIVTV
ncbi:MAG: isoamylase early set domain-containing protein [Proteobacteria bacterium]|nr:isoamylase early set domain-containing protein [Pseudomonadota bacterium]